METDAVLELLQHVAAEVITPRFQALRSGEVTEKRPSDLVTIADHEAEELITARLAAAYPDAVLLGEEAFAGHPAIQKQFTRAEHAFTIDPVDGTKNFVHGSPDHAVMVAEVRSGAVVRSWIWQPQHEVAYVAEAGGGAFANGLRLRVPDWGTDPATWDVRTSRRSWVHRPLPGLSPLSLSWVCCGVDYPQVIGGGAAALLYRSAKPWDHAPGSLLVTEAGGRVGRADRSAYSPQRFSDSPLIVAANDRVYDHLCPLL